jgi:hypothetical protein
MSPCPSARRQSTELPAKANIAAEVSASALAVVREACSANKCATRADPDPPDVIDGAQTALRCIR